MSTTLVGPEVEAPPDLDGGGGFVDVPSDGDGGGGGGSARKYDLYQTAVWVLMIPIVMFFVGLTSSLIVRKGISNDWVSIQMPWVLGLNTLILLASSVTLERARRALRRAASDGFRAWLWLTAGLGITFLLGQLYAWRQLAAQGVFVSSNPSSSFFYVLTATHGAHLLGGMAALIYLAIRALGADFGEKRRSALRATSVYWHFMDALWIYLFSLLIFWR